MPETYRAYVLDGTNRVLSVEVISAVNDQDAMDQVKQMKSASRREIWISDRLVGRIAGAADTDHAGLWL